MSETCAGKQTANKDKRKKKPEKTPTETHPKNETKKNKKDAQKTRNECAMNREQRTLLTRVSS